MSSIVILVGLAVIALVIFLSVSPATLAFLIRRIIPVLLIGAGALLMFLKQTAIGSLLLFGGLALFLGGLQLLSEGMTKAAGQAMISAPASRYWTCRSSIISGRVTDNRSLFPFRS